MKTPAKIKEAARYLVERYGDRIEYLGQYQGAEAFYYHFPEDVDAGFPSVYLLKDDEVTEIGGFFALEILDSFIEDLGEVGI